MCSRIHLNQFRHLNLISSTDFWLCTDSYVCRSKVLATPSTVDFGSGGTNWYFEYQLVLAQKYHRRVGSGRVAMFEW